MSAPAANPGASSKWAILFVVMAGTFMSILDVTMVNLALPHMMTSMQTDVQKVKWVVTALMLTAAVCMPPTGWLGRRFGYERMYIFSLMVFTAGAGLCSVAWDLPSLIVFRIVEAVGGGIMQPVGMAIIVRTFPVEERGRALGFWGIGAMMAPTLGPTLGGYFTDWFGWRSIFAVNVPVGILTLYLALSIMRGTEREEAPPPFDWQGYLALAVFLVVLLLGLEEGRKEGWSSTPILLAWAVAAVALTLFIATELTVENPVFPFALFRRRDFALGFFLALSRAVGLFGSVFLLPLFLQTVQWHDSIHAGLVLMPGALMVAATMPLAGYLTDRIGSRLPASVGVALTAYSLYLFHRLDVNTGFWDILLVQIPRGVGIGFMMAPVMAAAMNAVPRHLAGTASALLNVAQRAGGSFGVALLATMLERRTITHLESLSDAVSIRGEVGYYAEKALVHGALAMGYGADATQAARATIMGLVAKSAASRAFGDVFVLAAWLTLLGLPAALFLTGRILPRRKGGSG